MIELPSAFKQRMRDGLGEKYGDFINSYDRAAYKGIRVNTLKISPEDFKKISPFELTPVAWEHNGFYVNGEKAGKTILHAAGLYYVQEPSAMSAAPLLQVKPGERVLDLCSAPGGKGTQLAQAMRGEGILVLNEIDFRRFKILESNVERLGVKNSVTTWKSPEKLSEIFTDYFDKILVDAPCSGEGMFLKEPNAIAEWSVKNVETCAERQEKILACADKMLAGGGRMVYSTCTFAPEEDERQIENFLKTHPQYALIKMKKLLPHEVRGEGHFCALLQKNEGARREIKSFKPVVKEKTLKVYRGWEAETLNFKAENIVCEDGCAATSGQVHSFLNDLPAPPHGIHFNSTLFYGMLSPDGKRFEPSHRLVMSLKKDEVKHFEVDEQTALNYLRGLTFNCPANEKGWRAVTYLGYPLGWCKAVNGVAKNHLPKGLRI
ncbi:MAG: hypothetical protein NC131_01460 [Roseburia sp.]|nr:hypothetical protein [Roseburia sp.]